MDFMHTIETFPPEHAETIDMFLASHRTAFSVRSRRIDGPSDRDQGPDAHHFATRYRCDLLGANGERLTTTIVTTNGKLPGTADVLDALAAEAAVVEEANCFEAWAVQMGFDPDSRHHERIYRASRRQAKCLRRMLGDADYDRLLWRTSRL
jgi:hypothetical protein